MKYLIQIILFVGYGGAVSFESLILEEWKAFKTTFNKSYNNEQEESFRREIFLENRHKIAMHNIDFGRGIKSFYTALNRWGDMLNHEFTYVLNGFNRTARLSNPTPRQIPKNIRSSAFIRPTNVQLPAFMDWRQLGAVTPVKNQGLCASCYAFTTCGALEGHWFRKTGKLQELSPQNVLDCTKPYGNSGCSGGLMDGAYEYIRDNYGINSEPGYPYEGHDNQCRFRQDDRAAQVTGYVLLDEGDEDAIKQVIATLGPVSVAIDAGQDSFQFYSDGVYYEPNCESAPEKMNHAVLIVGYGQEDNGFEYWIVKNTYGSDWGQGGYIKMARNANNHCGIANSATYPLV